MTTAAASSVTDGQSLPPHQRLTREEVSALALTHYEVIRQERDRIIETFPPSFTRMLIVDQLSAAEAWLIELHKRPEYAQGLRS